MVEQLLTENKVEYVAMEFNSVEAIKQCVMKGVGVAIIPRLAVREEIALKKLKALSWPEENLETAMLMIWHKDKWLFPTLRAFMDIVREHSDS